MKVLLTAIAILVLLSSSTWSQFISTSAVISIDTVEAQPGTSLAIPIRLANNGIDIAGLQIPLKFESSYLTVDSVSFAGSLKPTGSQSAVEIDNAADTLAISLYPVYAPTPFAVISAAEGILATIHCTLDAGAPDGTIPLDTIYSGHGSIRWTGVGFADPLGMGMYLPASVIGGAVKVLSPTDVGDDRGLLPSGFGLAQNYPNPFNPATTIEFSIPTAGPVRLDVFNVLGQTVATLVERPLSAGVHRIEFDASDQPSGIYFYRLTHASGSQTQKMILLK